MMGNKAGLQPSEPWVLLARYDGLHTGKVPHNCRLLTEIRCSQSPSDLYIYSYAFEF